MVETHNSLAEAHRKIGEELGVSDWVSVDQVKIDAHAQTTGDTHWIHNDPERAAQQSPFGGKTIAQGSLLLSHLVSFQESLVPFADDVAYALNYGFDRVRFISPVPAGARIRGRMVLRDITAKGPGRYLVKTEVTVEVEGNDKPALVAEWLGLTQQF